MSKRDVLLRHYPWTVPEEHRGEIYRLLELHGEYFMDAGKGMAESDLERLREFWAYLHEGDLVVEYNPWAAGEKWSYQPRKPEDEKSMVRENRHTRITPEGQVIWRLPAE
ncbi:MULTISPECIES: hypothetical protein [Nocardia]|uniref:hypothetical protein n=1 Tax=Nocardia TaxID=1817 RepID=UPI0007A4B3E9|nr:MULTISPECIES: hypothetical protein [Nocardia]